jgi:hypothetical protein
MIAVHVNEDGAIAVYAAAKEVHEVFIRNFQRTKREALSWRQSDLAEPFIQRTVVPTQVMAMLTVAAVMLSDRGRQAKAASHSFEEVDILRSARRHKRPRATIL